MKCYVGGSVNPNDFQFVSACFASNAKEAKRIMWNLGELANECEGEWLEARVIRQEEHDYLFGKDGRNDAHVINDDWTMREMGWMIDGDSRCCSCGKADYDGKWPLCCECDSCPDCGHDDECTHPTDSGQATTKENNE